jgi:uncharacterized protein (DUF58 family)
LGRAVLVASLLVLLAVLFGRFDLVLLATPFALGAAWGLHAQPHGQPSLRVSGPELAAAEGADITVQVTVTNPEPVRYDLVVTRLLHSPWLRLRHGDRPFATDLSAGQVSRLELTGPVLRWGRHDIGPAQAYAVAGDGLLVGAPGLSGRRILRAYPDTIPFKADAAMARAAGLVGIHRSRRPGEGGELAGIRRHAPGDRLRRIDWRVTLRTRELHIAQTFSDRDAEVVVLLDVLYDVGQSQGIFGAASVLDTTVRASAAIAEHYLTQGDRVALLEFSGHPRHLRAASGRRQLHTIQEWLLDTRAVAGSGEPPDYVIDPHLVPTSALVVVLTPLLGVPSIEMIARLARAGRVVVAVDTLGKLVNRRLESSKWTPVARQLWRIERENTIGQLREVGVPVVAWAGAGSLDDVLRDVIRMAAAPRVVRR